jgi:hypothetical protein
MKNLILAGVAIALIAASVPADAQHETNKGKFSALGRSTR